MLGPAVLRLSSVYLDSLEFRSRALKWAEELARRTGASVRAGVLLLDDVIVVHHEPRPDGSRQMPEVGFVVPAHASALGKALLAFEPRSHAWPAGPLRSMTGETIVDPARLADHLTEIARTGVATEHDEAVLGESSLAAPIFDATGAAVGAIAVVLQSSEWPPRPDAPRRRPRSGAQHLPRARRIRLAGVRRRCRTRSQRLSKHDRRLARPPRPRRDALTRRARLRWPRRSAQPPTGG